MSDTAQTAYGQGKLLLSIVARNWGDRVVEATKHAGARGGTIVMARGTAESSLVQILGMGDTEKDVVFTLASPEQMPLIVEALRTYAEHGHHRMGVAMLIDVPHILKHLSPSTLARVPAPRRSTVKPQSDHALITFIVNRGYADDAMIAARKAGATGGTILHARGTGKEEDVKFFGVSLVPEKEILLVLVETDKADSVLRKVKEAPFLSEPGSGIAFRIDVEEFLVLGGRPAQEHGEAGR